MGKDHEVGEACCQACERWGHGAPVEAPPRTPLTVDEPGAVALAILRPGREPRTFVPEGPEITIGRGATNTLVVDDTALSRRQARLVVQGSRLFVEDLNSTCGTFVDGHRASGLTELGDGAEISFGNVRIRVDRR